MAALRSGRTLLLAFSFAAASAARLSSLERFGAAAAAAVPFDSPRIGVSLGLAFVDPAPIRSPTVGSFCRPEACSTAFALLARTGFVDLVREVAR